MKQLLLDIVNSIVDNPDKVKLEETTDSEGNLNYTLTVDPSDMGKIIGKEGKVIKSIRNIIRIPAIKQDKKVNLELTEQERLDKPEGEAVGAVESLVPASSNEEVVEDKTSDDTTETVEKEPKAKKADKEETPSETTETEPETSEVETESKESAESEATPEEK